MSQTPLPSCGHPLPAGRGEGRGEGHASIPKTLRLCGSKSFPQPASSFFQPEEAGAVRRAVGGHVVITDQRGGIGDRRPVRRGDIGGGLELVIGRPGRPADHVVRARPRQAHGRWNTGGGHDGCARAGHALEGEINRIIPRVGVRMRSAHLFPPGEIGHDQPAIGRVVSPVDGHGKVVGRTVWHAIRERGQQQVGK